jgi:hypothetical protein
MHRGDFAPGALASLLTESAKTVNVAVMMMTTNVKNVDSLSEHGHAVLSLQALLKCP